MALKGTKWIGTRILPLASTLKKREMDIIEIYNQLQNIAFLALFSKTIIYSTSQPDSTWHQNTSNQQKHH